jgi:hypothetical protein
MRLGAVVTAVLFELGKSAIGFYIGRQGLESTYGAAASIIVVLIWVYYSSQIILVGAEITHAFAKHQGSLKNRELPLQDRLADDPSRSRIDRRSARGFDVLAPAWPLQSHRPLLPRLLRRRGGKPV